MIILHIIPTLEGGGAERQLSFLACEQAKRGLSVHVAVRRLGVYESILLKSGVFVHCLGDHKSLSPILFISIFRLVYKLQPSIIQTWLPQMDIIGGIVSILFGIPWIGTERSSKSLYQEKRFLTIELLRRWLFRRAFAVVTNSKLAANEWSSALPFNVKVVDVPNGIDVGAIRKKISSKSIMTFDEPPIILVVGRLVKSKGVEIVIGALVKLAITNKFKAYVIGDGPFKNNLLTLIDHYDLNESILFVPYSNEWWSYMSNSSMLISMSRIEGQPNVVLEAMVGGCPLIVSDIPSHRELLNDETSLIVEVDNVEDLLIKIKLIIKFPLEAKIRAKKAMETSEQFTISNMVDSYSQIYELAVQQNR